MTAPALPSATVVLRRGPEVLLVQRSSALRNYAGMWVFPGGRVDAVDAHADPLVAARRAAARELAEETGVRLDPAALRPLARWTTPVERSRRFRAWFFLADATTDAVVQVDQQEIVGHRWVEPVAALERQAAGEWILPPPVFVTLTALGAGIDEAAEPLLYDPRTAPVDGGHVSLYAGDAGFESGDAALPGARHRLWMDGPRWRYERGG